MRNAFTMIELIFAIVVIAISILSLPMMMRVNQNAMEGNVVQEAVFASSAKMMQVLSYPWDQHAQDSTNMATYTKIVSIPGGTAAYARTYDMYGNADGNGSFRIGAIIADGHRRFHNYLSPDANITTTLGTGSTEALSNIAQNNVAFDNTASSATGYKDTYTMDVSVSYITDNGAPFIFNDVGNTLIKSNMKLITVSIKSNAGTVLALLRSYSANIGEVDFAKRRF